MKQSTQQPPRITRLAAAAAVFFGLSMGSPGRAAGLSPSATVAPAPVPPVVVIEGDILGQGAEYMRPEAQQHARTMCGALKAARVPYATTRDSVVAKQGLPPARVAILPYNRAIPDDELGRLTTFLKAGGKIIVCFLAPQELLGAIGVRGNAIIRRSKRDPFTAMTLEPTGLPGMPQRVAQASDRIRGSAPLSGARVMGHWVPQEPSATHPAVILSPTGAFISHVLLDSGDRRAQAQLIRALCAYFAPEIWRDCIPRSPEDIRPLGNYRSLGHMQRCLADRQRAGEDVSVPMGAVAGVVAALSKAQQALAAGQVNEAAQMATQAEALAQRAYWMSYPSPSGELRGVWACNSVPGGWPQAIKTLRAANLNAVFPYVSSAGVAWFNSDYLPRASDADDLAAATSAGRQYGIPVHARTLGMYTMCAPATFKDQLRKEGRLMISGAGKVSNWLCPVNPANRRLTKQVALEIVTRYPVTGFQIDYMRYPGESYCFCPICRKAFSEAVGKTIEDIPAAVKRKGPLRDAFLQWRRENVTGLVREVSREVRKARPDIIISAAVFLNWEDHRETFAQDWKRWVDTGIVDLVCPMDYTPSNDRFAMYVQRQTNWVGGRVPLCPGIGVNADNMTFGGPQALLDQITIARNLKTQGWVIFNYHDTLVTDYLPYLKLGATSTPASFRPFRRALMPPVGG